MKTSLLEKFVVPVLVACIYVTGTLGSALIMNNQRTPSEIKPNTTPSYNLTEVKCAQVAVTKVCVSNVTVQIDSDEPEQVKNNERIPLKVGDKLRVVNLHYCILPEATVNKIEVKAFLFKHGVEGYNIGLFTPSTLPVNTGCHNIGNFEKTWKLEPGQHRVSIPIIKYDGSNRVVDKSFYLNLDVGQYTKIGK